MSYHLDNDTADTARERFGDPQHSKIQSKDAIELVEVFLKHHTGQIKMSNREIFNACYNAGRVLGTHTNPKVEIFKNSEDFKG